MLGKNTVRKCYLNYRVLPSCQNKFVQIFGDNEWRTGFKNIELITESDFINFVKNFKTLSDIRKYLDGENNILWHYPPTE